MPHACEAILSAASLIAGGGAHDLVVFNYLASAEVRFSSIRDHDVISAEIVGTSCEAANVRIEITTPQHETVYEFTRELSRFIPCSYLERFPHLKDDLCQKLVDKVTTEGVQRRTSDLESADELKSQPPGGYWTAPDHDSIREKNLAMLCHPTANEHLTCLALDRELRKVVTVVRCSM